MRSARRAMSARWLLARLARSSSAPCRHVANACRFEGSGLWTPKLWSGLWTPNWKLSRPLTEARGPPEAPRPPRAFDGTTPPKDAPYKRWLA
eukprot:scaffold38565_cov56-Phaeocystis_antarctica.AAC.3